MGTYIDLLVGGNDNVVELDYGCGSSSTLTPDFDRCEIYRDDKDCEDKEANNEFDKDRDDESNGDIDVSADRHVSSFYTLNQVLENKQEIYVCDAPKSGGLLIIHQPTKSLWISYNSIPHHCVPFTRIHNLTKIE